MSHLNLGLIALTPAKLVEKCSFIEKQMQGNPNFPSPTPTLADLGAKREQLSKATAVAHGGDITAISERNIIYKELETMLRSLAMYISMVAAGRGSVILSSGFEVRKKHAPLPPVTRPLKLKLAYTDTQGRIDVRWKPVPNAKSYLVEITTTDPSDPTTVWTQVAICTRSKTRVDNLTIATYYWFRVCAVGTKNISGYSNPGLIMAA